MFSIGDDIPSTHEFMKALSDDPPEEEKEGQDTSFVKSLFR